MKKEELDPLRAKYLQGETSLAEERLLKEHSDDAFFGGLREPSGKMDWDFDAFMEATAQDESEKNAKVINLPKRIIMITSIAASVLIGFLIFRPKENAEQHVNAKQIAQHSVSEDRTVDAETLQQVIPETPKLKENRVEESVIASIPRSQKRPQSSVRSEASVKTVESPVELEEELYVEVNGVRIYNEEEALKITETALHLATSNLKRGAAGLEKIKHLNIEI